MYKSIIILMALCMIFTGSLVWGDKLAPMGAYLNRPGEFTPKEEKRLMVGFNKPLPERSIGRFQAIRINDAVIFILDTKKGHTWSWHVGGKGLIYQGYCSPDINLKVR